ncbi:Protein PLASTID MOVEMENT IMPAIRED 1-RELATED 1 [Zea mays]|uniref:Protein PLASTID MOVEMENT IMPAIRED 1-RELATED 1 n=1 Tax=Zea mays TaxID=4577 RepID=A0A3L6FSR8_MAIZE|nr:Protein PLASTID MOVEMENT IMPAIRED 1-RELATED 1 [Zea mays]
MTPSTRRSFTSCTTGMGSHTLRPFLLLFLYFPTRTAMGLDLLMCLALNVQHSGFVSFDASLLLHGQQYIEIYRPIPSYASVVNRVKVAGLHDKVCDDQTKQSQACYFICLCSRLSGDYNPLHSDPDIAQLAGVHYQTKAKERNRAVLSGYVLLQHIPSSLMDDKIKDNKEVLTLRSPVYFSRGAKAVVKYEPHAFAISVAASTLDLGKHEVDLTRPLSLSFEDLEDGGDSGFGKWSTSFRLSGPAHGARLNVTFSCSLLAGGGTSEQHRGGEVAGLQRGSMVRPVSVQTPTPLPARSRDVRVLHEVLPSLRSARPVPSSVADGGPDARKEEVAAPDCTEEGSPEAKHCTSVEIKKGDSVRLDGDWGTMEFNVVEHGVEVASDDPKRLKHVETSNAVDQEEDSGFKIDEEGSFKPLQVSGDVAEDQTVGVKTEVVISDVAVQRENVEDKQDGIVKAASLPTAALEAEGQFGANAELEDECILNEISVAEPKEFESPVVEDKHSRQLSCTWVTDSYKFASRKGRSRSMDASTGSVANEFLDMLGIEHSPVGQPSDSDSESPRERLWKQFEKEALASGNAILGLDFDDGIEGPICDNVVEDFDLSAMIHEAELELQNGSQPIDTKFRAKSLEDKETEALMRQFGLNEKSFQYSPPETRTGGLGLCLCAKLPTYFLCKNS